MDNSPQSPDSNKSKQKWITDFAMMTNINRFILSTGDRELQFFETSTFEPYCQIRFLPTVKCHFLLILCYVCFRGTNTFEPYCQIRFLPTVTFCWFCVMFVSVTGGIKPSAQRQSIPFYLPWNLASLCPGESNKEIYPAEFCTILKRFLFNSVF